MKITASFAIKKAILLALVVGVTGCKTSSKTRTKPANNTANTQKTVVTDQGPAGTTPEIDKMAEEQRKREAEAAEARKKAEAEKKAKDDAAAAAAIVPVPAAAPAQTSDTSAEDKAKKEKEDADRKAAADAAIKAKADADKKAKEEADKKTQAILDAAKKKQEEQEKKIAEAKAAAEKKAAEVKPEKVTTDAKSSAGNGNMMNAKLEIVQDEAKVLKGDTCSLALAKSEKEGLALKMTVGETSIDMNFEADWVNEKDQTFNKETLEKIAGQKVGVMKANPPTFIIMIFQLDKASNVVILNRTYYTITDKSIGEIKNPQQIADYVKENAQKAAKDASYDGMHLSIDALKVQLNEKSEPVAFSYMFQDVENGTTDLTDGKTPFKSKNNIKVSCKSEAVAATK